MFSIKFIKKFVLFLEICHSYQAFNLTYSDTGLFGIYTVCEPEQLEQISKNILDAWHRVSYSITDSELEEAKNRLITKLLTETSSKCLFVSLQFQISNILNTHSDLQPQKEIV